jgi:hypothetical protein
VLIEYLRGCKNLRRLCGGEPRRDIPSESTFSRAFAEYAQWFLPQKIHEAMFEVHLTVEGRKALDQAMKKA